MALTGRRTLARPVLALLRRVPERVGWRAGVAEGAVVALAGASLFAASSDRGSPLALLAPAQADHRQLGLDPGLLGRGTKIRHTYNELHTITALLFGRPGLFGHRFPGMLSMLPWMPESYDGIFAGRTRAPSGSPKPNFS